MNRQFVIEHLATQTGLHKKDARDFLDAYEDMVMRKLIAGEKVAFAGIGTLQAVERAERMARNPQTGDKVKVSARFRLRFSASTRITDILDGKRKLPPTGNAARKADKGGAAKMMRKHAKPPLIVSKTAKETVGSD